MNDQARSRPTIDALLCGNGINFLQGDLALSGVFLIQAEDAGTTTRIVVDSGHVGMRRNVLGALASRGLRPDDIHVVVLTHTHWDHVQNVDLFPGARLALSHAELDSLSVPGARDIVTPAWTRRLFEDGNTQPLSPGDYLAPGVQVLDAAGHTAGSIGIAVETGQGVAVVTGDALPWAEVGMERKSALVFWDLERSQRTIEMLVDVADTIYPGHDRPFRLEGAEIVYDRPFDATVFGATPDLPGLTFAPPVVHRTIDMTDGDPVGPRWTKGELDLDQGT